MSGWGIVRDISSISPTDQLPPKQQVILLSLLTWFKRSIRGPEKIVENEYFFQFIFKCKFRTKLQQYRKLDLPSGIINKFESKIHLDTKVTQKMQHENDNWHTVSFGEIKRADRVWCIPDVARWMTPVALLPLITLLFPRTWSNWNLPDWLLLNRLCNRGTLERDTPPDGARRSLLKPAWNVDGGDIDTDSVATLLASNLSCRTCSDYDLCTKRISGLIDI